MRLPFLSKAAESGQGRTRLARMPIDGGERCMWRKREGASACKGYMSKTKEAKQRERKNRKRVWGLNE
eukprot:6189865-Pleurochrysis_carterae.AAC.2